MVKKIEFSMEYTTVEKRELEAWSLYDRYCPNCGALGVYGVKHRGSDHATLFCMSCRHSLVDVRSNPLTPYFASVVDTLVEKVKEVSSA